MAERIGPHAALVNGGAGAATKSLRITTAFLRTGHAVLPRGRDGWWTSSRDLFEAESREEGLRHVRQEEQGLDAEMVRQLLRASTSCVPRPAPCNAGSTATLRRSPSCVGLRGHTRRSSVSSRMTR